MSFTTAELHRAICNRISGAGVSITEFAQLINPIGMSAVQVGVMLDGHTTIVPRRNSAPGVWRWTVRVRIVYIQLPTAPHVDPDDPYLSAVRAVVNALTQAGPADDWRGWEAGTIYTGPVGTNRIDDAQTTYVKDIAFTCVVPMTGP